MKGRKKRDIIYNDGPIPESKLKIDWKKIIQYFCLYIIINITSLLTDEKRIYFIVDYNSREKVQLLDPHRL